MKVLFILILFSFLGGCNKKADFNSDYPFMKDVDHVYEKIDYDKAKQIFTEGTGVVILAFNSNKKVCPFCIEVLPILNEVAQDLDYQKIYYLDIYDMRKDNTKEYQALLNLISNQVDDLVIRDDKLTLVVPDVYMIKNGVIVGHHIATLKDENNQYLYELNDNKVNELKEIYRNLFSLLT